MKRIALSVALIILLIGCGPASRPGTDHLPWTDSVGDAFNTLVGAGRPDQALFMIDSLFQTTPDRGTGDWWRKYFWKANYYQEHNGDSAIQIHYIDSMFSVLKGRERSYRYEYCQTLFAKAAFLRMRQEYSEAIQYYYDGKHFAQQGKDTGSMTDFNNSIALIFYQQSQYEKAIQFYRQALQVDTTSSLSQTFYYGFYTPQGILNNIGLCFERMGMTDSAIAYYRKTLEFIAGRSSLFPERVGFIETATATVKGNLGGMYVENGQWAEAETYLQDDIRINDRPGFPIEDAQTAKVKLANLYLLTGRFSEASNLMRQIGADLHSGRGKSSYNTDIRERYYKLMWKYADATGNLAQAYGALRQYYFFRDSLDKTEARLKNADIDATLKEKDEAYRLSLLEKNNDVKNAYLSMALIILVLALSVAALVWIGLVRTRGHARGLNNLNKQLMLALAALKKSQEDNVRMVIIAAHDLRNPIGAMVSGISLMLSETHRRGEEDNELLRLLLTSGENALSLVGDILQVNTNVGELEREPVDLAVLVRHCIDLLLYRAKEKSQDISLQARPVVLRLSWEKMWRVISNLIANAIKFSPTHARIEVSLSQEEGRVLVSVKDNGIGIPPEWGDKVFDLFTKARRKGTNGEQSFGLGLAVSKQIVEAHGGTIWFVSEPGAGTVFYISFPADQEIHP